MPDRPMLPMVGLMVYKEARVAGEMSEPIESVPSDMGAYPAETSTAEPVEEPPGFCKSCSQYSSHILHVEIIYRVSNFAIFGVEWHIGGLCMTCYS